MPKKYSHVINESHVFIPLNELRDPDKARERTTAVRTFDGDPVPMYSEKLPGYLGVPRYHFKNLNSITDDVQDECSRGHSVVINFTSKYRPGQREVLRQFMLYYKAGKSGFIFEAPPGFGKTVCLIKMLCEIGKTALVVVPRSNLVKQWIARLLDHTDLEECDIGYCSEGTGVWKNKAVVVGLVHTLALNRFGENFGREFGVVVFDEVDRSVPPMTFAPVIGMFPAKYRIGASAVVHRQDGLDVVFRNHVGECFIKGADMNRMAPKVLVHYYNFKYEGVWKGLKKLSRRGVIISQIGKNVARNHLIARYVRLIYRSGRRVLVLSDRIEQLIDIRKTCSKLCSIPLEEMDFYVSALPKKNGKKKVVSKAQLESVASESRVIFASYGMIGLGTDIPDLAGLIYATPQSETEQTRGRIERVCSGKKQPVVIDLIDTFYEDTRRWGRKRVWQYQSKGLVVKQVRG